MEMTSGKFYGNDGDGTANQTSHIITVCEGHVLFGTLTSEKCKKKISQDKDPKTSITIKPTAPRDLLRLLLQAMHPDLRCCHHSLSCSHNSQLTNSSQ